MAMTLTSNRAKLSTRQISLVLTWPSEWEEDEEMLVHKWWRSGREPGWGKVSKSWLSISLHTTNQEGTRDRCTATLQPALNLWYTQAFKTNENPHKRLDKGDIKHYKSEWPKSYLQTLCQYNYPTLKWSSSSGKRVTLLQREIFLVWSVHVPASQGEELMPLYGPQRLLIYNNPARS